MSDRPPITYGTFYHIFNRGNNRENIFVQERNYAYFLALWWKHISPIAETWAYCLLKNHFHAVVRIKNREDIVKDLTGLREELILNPPGPRQDSSLSSPAEDLSGLKSEMKIKDPSQYFSNFFNAYARGINISIQRSGALFQRPFERIPVDSTSHLMRLIIYVHQNPQKHCFVKDFRDWNYSSYHALTTSVPTPLQREAVLKLFGSHDNLVRIHQEIQPLKTIEDDE